MNIAVPHQIREDPNAAGHQAEALVLSCMDYRLMPAIAAYLEAEGLAGNYDHVVIAGGALGVAVSENEAWQETFWQHLALAQQLHGIRRVILMDHRDCGACKILVGPDCAKDPDIEVASHMRAMEALADEIRTRAPELSVEVLFMDLDGSVTRFDT